MMDGRVMWLVVVLAAVAVGPASVRSAAATAQVQCTAQQIDVMDKNMSIDEECSCEKMCDENKNLHCVGQTCQCMSDTVWVNQTCLPKRHYHETCEMDSQCTDLKQKCTEGRCECKPGYRPAAGHTAPDAVHTCRQEKEGEGTLGANCSTVSDCNWMIEHAMCFDNICTCIGPYRGRIGGTKCQPVPELWNLLTTVLGLAVIVVGVMLLATCLLKSCQRSHQRMWGRVSSTRSAGDVSRTSSLPPPYVSVISDKTANPIAADPATLYCADNYSFAHFEQPYSVSKS